MTHLNPKAFAIALGGTWAIGIILIALFSMISGTYGSTIIGIVSSVYLGYDNTIPGALIGGIWAFIDGGVAGWIFAWIYNRCLE